MCLDYNRVEMDVINRKIREKIGDLGEKAFKIDPLFEADPNLSHLKSAMHSLTISHGKWIEDSLRDFITAIPDWGADARVRLTINGETIEIDNIAFNQSTGQVVLWEIKRRWENLDGPAQRDTKGRFDELQLNKAQLTNELKNKLKSSPTAIDMAVFNCWGTQKTWMDKYKCAYPIYCRDEIGSIFGSCLWDCIVYHRDFISSLVSDLFNLPNNIKEEEGNPFAKWDREHR